MSPTLGFPGGSLGREGGRGGGGGGGELLVANGVEGRVGEEEPLSLPPVPAGGTGPGDDTTALYVGGGGGGGVERGPCPISLGEALLSLRSPFDGVSSGLFLSSWFITKGGGIVRAFVSTVEGGLLVKSGCVSIGEARGNKSIEGRDLKGSFGVGGSGASSVGGGGIVGGEGVVSLGTRGTVGGGGGGLFLGGSLERGDRTGSAGGGGDFGKEGIGSSDGGGDFGNGGAGSDGGGGDEGSGGAVSAS